MMPNPFKEEYMRLWVIFGIEINRLCNMWVSRLSSGEHYEQGTRKEE